MKVLLLSHTCISRTAGQPKAHALAAFPDVDLTLLVPDRMKTYGQWHDAETPDPIPAFRYAIGRTRWRSVRGLWYLQHYSDTLPRLLSETQPDVVDVWEEPWSLACAQAVSLTRRLCPAAKIIVETEQNLYKRLPPPFRQFQSFSLRRADYVVARNEEAVTVLRRKGYAGPVEVVPNAVDCDLFRPLPPEEGLRQRAALGWGGAGEFVVGYVGRLVPEKGLADALTAVARLPERVRLAFVGEGPLREALAEQAERLGIADRVHLAGNRPLTSLPECMSAMSVLILPSRTTATWKEQFGRVLIEAGACALPVVGSDSGAIPEVIADAGLTFPEGDAAALTDRLHTLLSHPDQCTDYGRIGRERAQNQFSWQKVAGRMHEIYRQLTDG